MIPPDHPRYRSLVTREHLASLAREGIVTLEGLTAHGRGEAFDYLLGERTTASALVAEQTAAALLRTARRPLFSVNGNTAALAAPQIALFQEATSGILVEVNLFHRTEERVQKITAYLEGYGVRVQGGTAERLLPLTHDRAYCLREGLYAADTVLVPLEDGDRAAALRRMGKRVIAIDLNPLSRTARSATLTIVDELTRALPRITAAFPRLSVEECARLTVALDNRFFLTSALEEMNRRLARGLD